MKPRLWRYPFRTSEKRDKCADFRTTATLQLNLSGWDNRFGLVGDRRSLIAAKTPSPVPPLHSVQSYLIRVNSRAAPDSSV